MILVRKLYRMMSTSTVGRHTLYSQLCPLFQTQLAFLSELADTGVGP